jgi:uncharacterized FAD-dependent dehydrogenase
MFVYKWCCSFSKRGSQWANSALVVNITPEDMVDIGGDGPLRGVKWQQVNTSYEQSLAFN